MAENLNKNVGSIGQDSKNINNAVIGQKSSEKKVKKDITDSKQGDKDKNVINKNRERNNKKEKKWNKNKFAERFNEFFKRSSSLVLFFVCAVLSTIFPFFIIPALGFMFRAALSDKLIESGLNNSNGIVKAASRCLYGATGVGLIKHIDKFVTNSKIDINSQKGYVHDAIMAEPKDYNKKRKSQNVENKEEKMNNLNFGSVNSINNDANKNTGNIGNKKFSERISPKSGSAVEQETKNRTNVKLTEGPNLQY